MSQADCLFSVIVEKNDDLSLAVCMIKAYVEEEYLCEGVSCDHVKAQLIIKQDLLLDNQLNIDEMLKIAGQILEFEKYFKTDICSPDFREIERVCKQLEAIKELLYCEVKL